jgi:lipoprotein-releasing system ATP-binding protein
VYQIEGQMASQATFGTTVTHDLAEALSNLVGTGELLRTEGLKKVFRSGTSEVMPFAGIDFTIKSGEMVAVVGPSGAGKSTLLHLLAALDTPTSGTVYFAGRSLGGLNEAELAQYRNRAIGFVWQHHHLLPDFTAVENVAMPLLVAGVAANKALAAGREWLAEVGLAERERHRAGELSGGEQQRVAIARALVNRPALLLADEPTGDLDERNADAVFELMQRLHRSHRLTSILATHNLLLARRADRVLVLEHGTLAPTEDAHATRANAGATAAWIGALTPGERG